MSSTVLDVEAANLDAIAEVEQWEREFQAEFYAPLVKLAKGRAWTGLNDATKFAYRMSDPDEAKQLERGTKLVAGAVPPAAPGGE